MAYLPSANNRIDEVEVTAEHRSTSIEVLSQLCTEVSSPKPFTRQLHVLVGHYEDPGFLNPKLFGFWILPRVDDASEPASIVGLERLGIEWATEQMREWTSPTDLRRIIDEPGARIQEPGSSSESSPSMWAVTLGSPVDTQIEATLTAIAMLIARRGLSEDIVKNNLGKLPETAERVDAETTKLVEEEIRTRGWRSACLAIQARAHAVGFSLHVTYKSPLLSASDAHRRMPLSRHVYNSFPGAQVAIDKIVNTLTQNWTLTGSASESELQKTRDMFENTGLPALLAHAVRDGLVCGVGALAMSSVPASTPWLLRPEEIELIDNDSAVIATPQGRNTIHAVLPILGGGQIDSSLGLSILEPFVVSSSNYDVYLRILLSAKVMLELRGLSEEVTKWAEAVGPHAESQLTSLRTATNNVFNPGALRLPAPTGAMYLPDRTSMTPDVGAISLGSGS